MMQEPLVEQANDGYKNYAAVSAENRRHQLAWTHKIRSLATSRYLAVKDAFVELDGDYVLRKATALEIATLQNACACTSQDWSLLCLLIPKEARIDQNQQLNELVSNNHFHGTNVLVLSSSTTTNTTTSTTDQLDPWKKCRVGIHSNRVISNSILSLQSWVTGNTAICDTHVDVGAVVMGCGSITAASTTSFSAHLSLSVGPETGGGRQVVIQPESDMIHVGQQITGRNMTSSTTTVHPSPLNVNIISTNCIVRDTPTLQGLYMAPNSSIHAATSVQDVVMLPTSTIQNSCTVINSRLQWNSSIVNHSTVSNSLLMEEAHVGPNSLVASSILGPDVHVSSGECQCSVLGPNTNAHHQSLCISILWPLGRGNVGYGANIGSNHTGRIPDQEVTCGEGVFWGLGSVIKFPIDMTMAPYSIVAAGTILPPQRICMPFSLIVSGSDGGRNSIVPGWVLSSSPYTIARSEVKYATRRKAKRHSHYTGWKILRPETIRMCCWARKQLEKVDDSQAKNNFVTDKVVPGIGDNVLSEKGRLAGIQAYTECIRRFALEGLLQWLTNHEGATTESALQQEFVVSESTGHVGKSVDFLYEQVEWPLLPWEVNGSQHEQTWSFQKQLLQEEFPMNNNKNSSVADWVARALENLVTLEKKHAASILKCKKRDDQRGATTVPGYARCHTRAEDDPVVVEAMTKARATEESVHRLLGLWKSNQRSKL